MVTYERFTNVLKRGISTTTIQNIHGVNLYDVERAYKDLLTKHVTDPDLLEVIGTEHNMHKIALKKRLEHHGQVFGYNGDIIGSFNVPPGTATTWEVIQQLRGFLPEHKEVQGASPQFKEFSDYGIGWAHHQDGRVAKIDLTTVFRRA